jgi:hypothetical protein
MVRTGKEFETTPDPVYWGKVVNWFNTNTDTYILTSVCGCYIIRRNPVHPLLVITKKDMVNFSETLPSVHDLPQFCFNNEHCEFLIPSTLSREELWGDEMHFNSLNRKMCEAFIKKPHTVDALRVVKVRALSVDGLYGITRMNDSDKLNIFVVSSNNVNHGLPDKHLFSANVNAVKVFCAKYQIRFDANAKVEACSYSGDKLVYTIDIDGDEMNSHPAIKQSDISFNGNLEYVINRMHNKALGYDNVECVFMSACKNYSFRTLKSVLVGIPFRYQLFKVGDRTPIVDTINIHDFVMGCRFLNIVIQRDVKIEVLPRHSQPNQTPIVVESPYLSLDDVADKLIGKLLVKEWAECSVKSECGNYKLQSMKSDMNIITYRIATCSKDITRFITTECSKLIDASNELSIRVKRDESFVVTSFTPITNNLPNEVASQAPESCTLINALFDVSDCYDTNPQTTMCGIDSSNKTYKLVTYRRESEDKNSTSAIGYCIYNNFDERPLPSPLFVSQFESDIITWCVWHDVLSFDPSSLVIRRK